MKWNGIGPKRCPPMKSCSHTYIRYTSRMVYPFLPKYQRDSLKALFHQPNETFRNEKHMGNIIRLLCFMSFMSCVIWLLLCLKQSIFVSRHPKEHLCGEIQVNCGGFRWIVYIFILFGKNSCPKLGEIWKSRHLLSVFSPWNLNLNHRPKIHRLDGTFANYTKIFI